MYRLACALLTLTTVAACSSNTFVGQRVGDFTAYYNTFYNARASFDEAMETAEPRDEPIVRTVFLPLFAEPAARSSNARFDNAVRKSADVLRDHGESRWADDALLLIGRTYFETRQFGGAQQKFREIIDEWPLQRGAPSPLADEAQFWLARSYVEAEQYEQAARTLEAALADPDLSERARARLLLVKGQLHVRQGAWNAAADALAQGLEGVRERDLRARGYFLLGQVHEKRGAHDLALEAFASVRRYRPPYLLEFAAEVSRVRMMAETGAYDAALERVSELLRDGKNYDFRNDLRLVRGEILQRQGAYDDAFYAYDELLYGEDAEPTSGLLRGRIHYAIGTLYRDAYGDYLEAAAQFDTAATKIGAGAQSEVTATGEAILDARELKRGFLDYRDAFLDVRDADSLLYLGSLDADAFAARVLEMREAEAVRLEAERRELERRQQQQAFEGTAATRTASGGAQVPAGGAAASAPGDQRGFLNYEDPLRVQEAYQAFYAYWGERPLVDNWRRRDAVSGAGRVELESSLAGLPSRRVAGRAGPVLPQIDVSGIPRTEESLARVRAELAQARYRLGTALFLGLERPDSAAVWFRRIIDESPDDAVSPRAYYALAQIQRSLGDTSAAHLLEGELIARYPDTDLAARLGAPVEAVPDTSALFAARYAELRARYEPAGSLDSSAARQGWRGYLALAAGAPQDSVAPKALLAAAKLWNVRLDSAAHVALAPLPPDDSLYLALGLTRPPDTTAPPPQPSVEELPAADAAQPPPEQPAPAERARSDRDPEDELAAVVMRMPDEEEPDRDAEEVAQATPNAKPRGEERPIDDEEPVGDELPVEAEEPADTLAAEPDRSGELAVGERGAEPAPGSPLASGSEDPAPAQAEPAGDPAPTLLDLYRLIAQAYPGTPYADRAQRVVDAVTEILREREQQAALLGADSDEETAETPLPDQSELLFERR